MNRALSHLIALTLTVTATSLLAADADKPIAPQSKTELFNGKDLTGWVSHLKGEAPAAETWSVKDGAICCTGKPNGFLRTEKSYTQYKVTVEWRFTKAGNTGVLVHMTPPDKVWPLCIECQGMHAAQGDMYFWSGAKTPDFTANAAGKKGNKVARKSPDAEKPVGEWNTYQVLCDKDTVTILVNGKEMNKATGCSLSAGQIGLQSEGAQIEVRRVTLEPLTP